ncbi:MAG TPA: ATP-binding cassette domain-containing protein [Candidatus Acidoferrales bacterium]|nr:ATP-binding cassette domain-containing protein [Candidatus Acidoferrales bacterium]
MDHAPVVRIRGLVKNYKDVHAVRGIDLDVPKGSLFGLIGSDGAGKSSTMKAVAGVMSYDEGTIEVFGEHIDSEASAERVKLRLGFMPQGLGQNLYPDLSIEENIDFFARLRLVKADDLVERKEKLLRMTRLDKFRDRAMKNLSGGMKQKLGLVCTLIHEPELIILDEPTTGVDPVSRRDFWAILAELLAEKGISALVSTAYMDEASRFHHAALMHHGRILAHGEIEELIHLQPGTVVSVAVQPQLEALNRLRSRFEQVVALGNFLRVFVPAQDTSADEVVKDVLSGLEITDVQTDTPELEDIYVGLLESNGEGQAVRDLPSPPEGTVIHLDPDKPVIEAKNLVRDFGAFRAVDHVTFDVRPGEIFGLLGANGAGKTTVIKMLTGILRPSEGAGSVAGADMRHSGATIKKRIGYMSQAFSLYQDLTVVENIRLYAGIYAVPPKEIEPRLRWIVDLAGLEGMEGALTGSLPMGLRQRLALGCALVHRPPILFLDEPTSGVDPMGRREFWDVLFRLSRQEEVGLLVTTHYMVEAEYCDRIALMHAGKVVAYDSPAGLKSDVERRFGQLLEVRCETPYKAQDVLRNGGFEDATLHGRRVQVLAPNAEQVKVQVRALLERAGILVHDIRRLPLTMENVFVQNVLDLEHKAGMAA